MKSVLLVLTTFSIFALASCEKCYQCESDLGTQTECCGSKADCESFRDNCRLTGGTNVAN